MHILVFLVIGVVAGFVAGVVLKGGGFGLVGDLVLGVLGALIGGWLFGLLGVSAGGGAWGAFVTALVGAIVLLGTVRLFKRA